MIRFVTLVLSLLTAFVVGNYAGAAAPPLDNCNTLCRERFTFYNYATGNAQLFTFRICRWCVDGRCVYYDPPSGNKCDDIEAPNHFDVYPGYPACNMGTGGSLVEGYRTPGDLINSVDTEMRSKCITVPGP